MATPNHPENPETPTMSTKLRTVTVSQLIDALQAVADDYDPDMPVLVAAQPNYPITELIDAVTVIVPEGETDGDTAMAWIGVSQPGSWVDVSPYAPRDAFNDEYL